MMHICIPKMKLFRCSCCSMFLENQDIFRDDASAKHTVTMGSYRVRNVLKIHFYVSVFRLNMSLSVAGVVIKPLQKKVGGDFQPHKHPTDFLSNVPEISSASLRDQQINIKKTTRHTSVACIVVRYV